MPVNFTVLFGSRNKGHANIKGFTIMAFLPTVTYLTVSAGVCFITNSGCVVLTTQYLYNMYYVVYILRSTMYAFM